MAWTKFIVQNANPKAGTGVKATLRKTKAGGASLGFTLTDEVAKQFDWADGDKLEVLIGDGAEHGLIRLRKNNSVGTALVVGKAAIHESHYFRLTLGHIEAFVNRSESAKWTQFEQVEDNWVEFVMPSWADETAPKKAGMAPARPIAPAVTAAAHFERPRRSAVSNLMGDPPPGRSALVAGK